MGHADEPLVKSLAEKFGLHLEAAVLPTGGAGLKVASLFNKETVTFVSSNQLRCKKNGRLCQYGLISTLISNKTENQFNVINVHFSAGSDVSDFDLREF